MLRTRTSVLVLGIIVSALGRLTQAATIIDFDDVPGPAQQRLEIEGDRYHSMGVLLSTPGEMIYAFKPPDSEPVDTPPTVIFGSYVEGGGADAPVIFDFVVPSSTIPRPTDFVSLYVYDSGGPPYVYRLEIFDVSNQLLDSIVQSTSNVTVSFNREVADIARLVFTPSFDLESVDTLQFNPIPEPDALLLFILGFGASRLFKFARATPVRACSKPG